MLEYTNSPGPLAGRHSLTRLTQSTWSVRALAVGVLSALALTACGGGSSSSGTASPGGGAIGGSSASSGSDTKLKAGLVFDIGGRGDKSFGASAGRGMDQAKQELGVTDSEAVAVDGEPESAKEERLRLLAQNGFNPVIAVGFAYGPSLAKVAPEFPEVNFAIIDDGSATGDNIANLTFAENEGSFLVGAAAALKSKTGNVGFIGGVQVPLIGKFEAGYEAGAKAVNPDITLQSRYLTQPPDLGGFADPAKATITADGMYQNGADVIYTAAGGSGVGTFASAKANGKLAIGVDSDQALTADEDVRDVILTSMIKNVDVAVFEFLKSVSEGNFTAGPLVYDLKRDGVDYSTTGGKVDDIVPQLDEFKQQIIDGTITVPVAP